MSTLIEGFREDSKIPDGYINKRNREQVEKYDNVIKEEMVTGLLGICPYCKHKIGIEDDWNYLGVCYHCGKFYREFKVSDSDLKDDDFAIPAERRFPVHTPSYVNHTLKIFSSIDYKLQEAVAQRLLPAAREMKIYTVVYDDEARICRYADGYEDVIRLYNSTNESAVVAIEEYTEIAWETCQDGYYHPDEIIDLVMSSDDKAMLNDTVSLREWFDYYNMRCKGFVPYDEEYEKAWLQKLNVANESEMVLLGWNPKMEFNSRNRKIASDRLVSKIREQMDCIQEYTIDTLINEGSMSGKQPVHIFLSATNSNAAKAIRAYTGDPLSHASISFDINMKAMYSFNKHGFVRESLDLFKKMGNIPIAIFTLFVDKVQVIRMKEKINKMLDRQKDFGYNYAGILGVMINRPINTNNRMFCSQFVDDIIRLTGINVTEKRSSGLVRPMDFARTKLLIPTFNGNINDYNPKTAISLLNSIKTKPITESNFDNRCIVDGGFYHNGRWNSIKIHDEYPDKLLRHRVEILIFKGKALYMRMESGNMYRIPGGSTERDTSNIQQVENEALEEARLLCKNITHTGMSYVELYPNPSKGDLPIQYDGSFNEIYIGEFDSEYTDDIDKRDEDVDMAKNGAFYDYAQVKDILRVEHKKACLYYLNQWLEESVSAVEFDNKGNLIVNKFMTNYQREFDKSHKLLLSYEANDNVDGMKYEVAKLWYINNKLESAIESDTENRKKLVDTRARVLNDFNKYLKYIQKHDKSFNFGEYIKSTPFDPDSLMVKKSTLFSAIDLGKKLLQKR